MKLRVTDIEETTVRVFPTLGRVILFLTGEKGDRTEVELSLSKLDKIAQLLWNVAETGGELGRREHYVWKMTDEDFIGGLDTASGFRLLPYPDREISAKRLADAGMR